MAFDFFKAQDEARRNTRLLFFLFGLAVLCIVFLTNLLLLLTLSSTITKSGLMSHSAYGAGFFAIIPWKIMGWVSLAVVTIIGLVVASKTIQMRQGGKVIAQSLGGTRLDYEGATAEQLVLLNVVEEMAIASGVPVPPVYLLAEEGVNAFAAGYAPSDAVIGITKGCLERLDRDQLQGVVAHEFSHILNGDMRMNIRLVALLEGILFIGHAGHFLLRSSSNAAAVIGIGNSKSKGSNNGVWVLVLAIGLIVLGYVGSFFGKLIKAAVSRQREFLADASAVQFTRNPRGIAGALKAIGSMGSQGSQIRHPKADEMSHMFFNEAISRWTGFFATHPPLLDRIRRIDSSWMGVFPSSKSASKMSSSLINADGVAGFSGLNNESNLVAQSNTTSDFKSPAIQGTSTPLPLPVMLIDSSHSKETAPSLVCACLIQDDFRARQMQLIQGCFTPAMLADVDRLYEQVRSLSGKEKLQLLQRTIPALKQQTQKQFSALLDLIHEIVNCDGRQDLSEWIVVNWMEHCVGAHFSQNQSVKGNEFVRLSQIEPAALCLLSVCSRQNNDLMLQRDAWRAGLNALDLPGSTPEPAVELFHLRSFLPELNRSSPMLKKKIWEMIQASILADKSITEEEGLLSDALALILELPKPSLLTSSLP